MAEITPEQERCENCGGPHPTESCVKCPNCKKPIFAGFVASALHPAATREISDLESKLDAEREKNKRLRELLRECEWARSVDYGCRAACPVCEGWQLNGHYEYCRLAAALKEADESPRQSCAKCGVCITEADAEEFNGYCVGCHEA